jgi:hypothetical protein
MKLDKEFKILKNEGLPNSSTKEWMSNRFKKYKIFNKTKLKIIFYIMFKYVDSSIIKF